MTYKACTECRGRGERWKPYSTKAILEKCPYCGGKGMVEQKDTGFSTEEIAEIVEQEGLGYTIQHYVDADLIEDLELREKWAQAKELLDEIEEAL